MDFLLIFRKKYGIINHKTAKRRFLRKPYANHGILKFYSERRLSRK
ncbi:hypothetical protein HMPREF1545_02775 [Oscillibacter sp. KLE 1728]|nr:hypothetical protein HMPREF1545_02775 [Oscillibacter sp. KLE 1728]ERK63875.1 hypothetical protein HMPREF1546_02005 [Oscillibacter sp. KLE 1745]